MFEVCAPVCFFLGANTPSGFVGYLNDLYDERDGWRAYLIKSGPGSGKSTLMRSVLQRVTEAGEQAEVILCSSDPSSLDGVILRKHKLCILDATAPHIIEPKYWGAVETIVDLGSCMNNAQLHAHAAEVIAATDTCADTHARCRKFISAAASLLADSARVALTCTDADKVVRTAARLADREFPAANGQPGGERRRFLSAITPVGSVVFYETLRTLCPRLYVLEDEYGAASRLLLAELRQRALEAGLEIVTCACPLAPEEKLEHLLIPELGLGFTTSNSWHRAELPAYRRIHAGRFTDEERIKQRRQLLSFNRRAAKELLGEAANIAAEAKARHDEMEVYSVAAMDREAVSRLSARIGDEIMGQIEEGTLK